MDYFIYVVLILVTIGVCSAVSVVFDKAKKNKEKSDTNAAWVGNIKAAQDRMKEVDSRFEKELAANDLDIASLAKAVVDNEKAIQAVLNDILSDEEAIAKQMGVFAGQLWEMEKKLDWRISDHVGDLRAEIEANDKEIAANKKEIKANDKDIAENEKEIKANDKDIALNTKVITDSGYALLDMLTEVEARLNKLKKEVKELEKEENKPGKKPGKK